MNWFTADYHLGEERLELLQRPFSSSEEMFEVLLHNHNAVVAKGDTVYFVGDVVYQGAKDPKKWLERINEFNGSKILIRGNHDKIFADDELKPYFTRIVSEGEGTSFVAGNIKCWINHYPTQAVDSCFNLVGHIHGAWKYQLNSLNVGIDVHHFRPMNEDKIAFYLNAITNFYDEDTWAAYYQSNYKFRFIRGKEASYLDNFPSKEDCLKFLENNVYGHILSSVNSSHVASEIVRVFLNEYKPKFRRMKLGKLDGRYLIKIPKPLNEALTDFCCKLKIRIYRTEVFNWYITHFPDYDQFEIEGDNVLEFFKMLNYNIDSNFFVKSFP